MGKICIKNFLYGISNMRVMLAMTILSNITIESKDD